ncbi:MAG: class I SAM-dependent methyltransferase [Treponema sp.]|jgi:O-methyltransferase involved in polyketide biosynthesis|nr:class I SAM-dependent methyltransferase [Treponema sp.]
MNSKKLKIPDLQGVQKTALLPLWGRAVFSRLYPEILDDKESIRIINDLDYNFSEIEKAFGEYGGLCYIIRCRKIDAVIKRFVQEHPNATVVNIGAGFDTAFSRVDNGTIRWYDIDLIDVITLRKKIIPEGPRNTCIAKSIFDYSWIKDVHFNAEDGILFVSGGVFVYFMEDDVRNLFITLADNFPAGELYFDGQIKAALRVSNGMVKKSGHKGAVMRFYINNPNVFTSWSPLLHLKSAEPYFKNIKRDARWKISTAMNMLFSDLLKMVNFYYLKFGTQDRA